jgi:signal transduction histidine kinase/ligand-binding sensor domain-containing protein
MRRPICSAVLFILTVLQAFSLDSNRHASYSETIWTQKDGLPQDAISAISQTGDGYLWLGTEEGLARFDGYEFIVYRKDGSNLPSNSITALATGSDGSLWIGTPNGLSHYAGNHFHNYSTADGLPDNAIADLFVDHAGEVWIVAGGAVARFDGTRIRLVAPSQEISVSPRAVCEDRHHVIWVAGSKGLARLVGQAFVPATDVKRAEGLLITRLAADGDDNLWLASGAGLMKYGHDGVLRKYTARDGVPDPHIRSLRLDHQGVLWVGTSLGFVHAAGDRFIPLNGPESERDVVRSIYEDFEGNLWVGTVNGLERFREDVFTTYGKSEGLPGDDPTTVFQDASGRTWVGFRNSGLILFSPNRQVFNTRNGLPSNEIFSIRQARNGDLLIGTRAGLVREHAGRFTTYRPPDDLGREMVFDAQEDAAGTLWIALPSGLAEFRDGKLRIVAPGDSLNSGWVISILQGLNGTLWAGTYGKGLWRIQGKDVRLFTTADGLSSNQIRSLYEDRDGTLWIATLGGGLNGYQNGRFFHVTAKDGLLSDNISELVDDSAAMWLGTTRGICSVSKRVLHAVSQGNGQVLSATNYGVGDGLRSAQCAPGYPVGGGAIRTREGRLWFPTSRGVGVINPKTVERPQVAPVLRMVGVTIDGKPVDFPRTLKLAPGSKSIHFHYVAIHLSAPQRVRYAHKLEGVDSGWVYTDSVRETDYNNLRPGRYRFLFRAELPGSGPSTQGSYEIEQLPEFYQTTWFRLMFGLLVLAAVAGGYLIRVRQLRSRFSIVLEERARLAREIHDTLAQGFIGISSQLEAVSAALTADSGRARSYLDLACKMARHSITEARRSVFELRAGELDGKDLAGALLAGAETWTAGSGLKVDMEIEASAQRRLPERLEQQLLRIAQEAIVNVTKHAGATKISVGLRVVEDKVHLRIVDDGQGFEECETFLSADGHFGLIGMRERAQQLDGELELKSCRGAGTQIEVTVPLHEFKD